MPSFTYSRMILQGTHEKHSLQVCPCSCKREQDTSPFIPVLHSKETQLLSGNGTNARVSPHEALADPGAPQPHVPRKLLRSSTLMSFHLLIITKFRQTDSMLDSQMNLVSGFVRSIQTLQHAYTKCNLFKEMSLFTKGNQYHVQILCHKHLFILVQIAFLSFCNFWGVLIVQVFPQQINLLFNTVIGTWMSPPYPYTPSPTVPSPPKDAQTFENELLRFCIWALKQNQQQMNPKTNKANRMSILLSVQQGLHLSLWAGGSTHATKLPTTVGDPYIQFSEAISPRVLAYALLIDSFRGFWLTLVIAENILSCSSTN